MAAPFTIRGLEGSRTTILGIWETTLRVPSSFGFSNLTDHRTEMQGAEVIWSVLLPGEFAQARDIVEHQAQVLQTIQQELHTRESVFRRISMRGLRKTFFSPEQSYDNTKSEDMLLRNLRYLQHGKEELSFSINWVTDWTQTIADYQSFMRQIMHLLKPDLCVMTQFAGVLYAYTQVGFRGDIKTLWYSHYTAHHVQLHRQNLSLALQSRRMLLEFIAKICLGAAILSARFGLPGGAMMALPATWRYLQDVMTQAGKLMNSSPGNDGSESLTIDC